MAAKSGYERLAQVDDFEDQEPSLANSRSANFPKSVNILSQPTHVHHLPTSSALHDSSLPATGHKTRHRSNSGIDIKAINARLER